MSDLPAGLRDWAELPGTQRVLTAVRKRVHRGGQLATGSLRVTLSPEERRHVARLLGTKWEVSGRGVTLAALGRALADHGVGLAEFVELIDGAPLPVRRELAAAERAEVEAEQRVAIDILRAAGVSDAVAAAWPTALGTPRAGTGACAELARRIAHVWPLLPWNGRAKRLGQLAAQATDDAHALDYTSELGRAVARLIAGSVGARLPSRPGREWRAAWLSAGVRCDTVSSRVLTLNVPLDITGGARAGIPGWLTLRDMLGVWIFQPTPAVLFVCENPTVVEAAADELGPRCPPLVCTDGIPSLAALDLVAGAAESGIDIRGRADVDRAGFVVVSTVESAAPGMTPWRFDAATYGEYFDMPVPDGRDLRGCWEQHGRDLHEEAILEVLLDDLRDC